MQTCRRHYPGGATVSSSILSNNSATYGGGIENHSIVGRSAFLTVSASTLSGNSATSGGAIFSHFLSTVHVGGSTFFGNAPDNIFGTYIDDGGNSGL